MVLAAGAEADPAEVTRWVGTLLAAAKAPREVHVVAKTATRPRQRQPRAGGDSRSTAASDDDPAP